MQQFARYLNGLGILFVLALGALAFDTAYKVGWRFASLEIFVLLLPFGTALAALSLKPSRWLLVCALLANGLLAAFGAVVLLGEFAWRMLGPSFTAGIFFLVTLSGILNCIAVLRVRVRGRHWETQYEKAQPNA